MLTFADVIEALTHSRPEIPPLVITEAAIDSRQVASDVDWLKENLAKNDVALVKGSHGLQMDKIVATLEVEA